MEQKKYQPYIFQSGKYLGLSVEEIIFKDPAFVSVLLSYVDKSKTKSNALHQNLNYLIDIYPKTLIKCPFCNQRSVKYILYLNTETILKELVCCDQKACQIKLQSNHLNDYLIPFKLSSIEVFRKKTLQKKYIAIFKAIIGLKGKVTSEKVIEKLDLTSRDQDTQLEIKF